MQCYSLIEYLELCVPGRCAIFGKIPFRMEKCDKAVMDFLAATDVGKFPLKRVEE
jgi:hypothetical protein